MPAAEMTILAMHFTWVALSSLLMYSGLLHLYQRRRKSYQADGRHGDGLLVMHEWGPIGRGVVLAFILVCVLVPCLIFVVAFFFAGILAAFEGWKYFDSFEYVLCNMVGISPVVNLVPSGAGGIAVDVLASMWSMLLTATVLGLSASINLFTHINSFVPSSFPGLLRVFLIYLPASLGVLAVGCGALLSALEDWSLGNGILFMIGSLCGIQDPLTQVVPSTDEGNFFVTICFCVELSVGGAIVGIVSSHPIIARFLVRCEGEIEAAESSITEVVAPTTDESGAQQKIQQLEQALETQRQECERRVRELEQALEVQLMTLERDGAMQASSYGSPHGSPKGVSSWFCTFEPGSKMQKE
jgi:hypothetical protein